MPSLLKHERISRFLRDLAHLGHHANGNHSVAAADAIDDLLEEIRVVRANHDQMCKDFDARNELLEKEQQAHLLTKGTLTRVTTETEMDIKELAKQAGFKSGCAHYPMDCEADVLAEFAKLVAGKEREAVKRRLLLDLWDALPEHEATGDTAGSLRAMLMLSAVGDEIKARSNAGGNSTPRDEN